MKFAKNLFIALTLFVAASAQAAEYTIDTKGAHASINFKFKHLNISWLTGEFKDFDGTFSFDEADPAASAVEVNIRTASIDTNHAERDKHMRSSNYLNTDKFPTAKFVSSKVEAGTNGNLKIHGELTFHGVTKEIVIDAVATGAGNDPWGGYRAGFEGSVVLNTLDFDLKLPPTNSVEMVFFLEGIRNK